MRKGPVEVKRSGLDGEVLSGKTIHLKDATADGRFQYPESAKAEGLVSVLSSPLMNSSPKPGFTESWGGNKGGLQERNL